MRNAQAEHDGNEDEEEITPTPKRLRQASIVLFFPNYCEDLETDIENDQSLVEEEESGENELFRELHREDVKEARRSRRKIVFSKNFLDAANRLGLSKSFFTHFSDAG